jgi:mannose-6-phosphate isomerase-like protein (cupin superfamily)
MISRFAIDRAAASQEFGTSTQRLVPWPGQGEEPPFGQMAIFLEAGAETTPDRHNQDELVIVLSGQADLRVEDEEVHLVAGQIAHLPRNSRHVLSNPGDEPLSWISVYWPLREPVAEETSGA